MIALVSEVEVDCRFLSHHNSARFSNYHPTSAEVRNKLMLLLILKFLSLFVYEK